MIAAIATTIRLIALAMALTSFSITAAAAAPRLTSGQLVDAERFAANNSLFILYHEIGHLLVHQLDLPVLGREEDAADNIATISLLEKHDQQSNRALADAARGWLLTAKAYAEDAHSVDSLAGEHSLDQQRAYQIVCLMVGSDPTEFGALADTYRIDKDRQQTCADDFADLSRSISRLVAANTAEMPHGADISITYKYASRDVEVAARAFRKARLFETVAADLKSQYRLPDPIQFTAETCGEPNAFYDRDTREVIFCYELMDEMYNFYARDLPADLVVDPRRDRQNVR